MSKLRIKQLDSDNWLKPDPEVLSISSLTLDGIPLTRTSDAWVNDILHSQLSDNIPDEIMRLFEVARGTMVYGYFFYPIFGLVYEQLSRVFEAAITCKCKSLGIPDKIRVFKEKLEWLKGQGVITDREECSLQKVRRFRNRGSHPSDYAYFHAQEVLDFLKYIIPVINRLFE
jgi:hypothetical protein